MGLNYKNKNQYSLDRYMKRIFFWTISSLMIVSFVAGCASKPVKPTEPYRVLFIGDSTTSRNDIPGKFERLAELGGHEVVVESSTKDYTSLATHSRLPQTKLKLENEVWDIVILQENEAILLNPESRQKFSIPMIEKYIDIVDDMGGIILLYSSIGFRQGLIDFEEFNYLDDYQSSQDAVDMAYFEIGNELNLPIAPVGEVWRLVYETEPAFDLWQLDGIHVSPEGAYLAACVFYTAIYNQSPLDLPISDEFGIDQTTIELIHRTVADVVLENPDQYRLPLFGP
jgi:hypothetical protein